MDKKKRLKLIRQYVANVAIGPTTLRNQGAEVAGAAREFLKRLRLHTLKEKDPSKYHDWLNEKTSKLMKKFHRHSQGNWGAARKAINIFMKGAYFNKVLGREYRLRRLKNVLETPLDGVAAKRIREYGKEKGVEWACKLCSEPKSCREWKIRCGKSAFPGIKNLQSDQSSGYQDVARELARELDLPRAEVYDILWGVTDECWGNILQNIGR